MLVAAPSGCCTGGMFSSGIHALGPLGAGEVTARVAPSTVALFLVDVHSLQADGSAGSTVGMEYWYSTQYYTERYEIPRHMGNMSRAMHEE